MSTEQRNPLFKFDMPTDQSQIIKVIGVGGGGSNAVNHMYELGINGVDFVVCNTDSQALDQSPVPSKIQLGASLTSGRGAGSIPEVGRNAAIENIDEVGSILENNTVMLFVTAGMGGGTGTGAAPVIAKKAKELGILTVGIVTMPFIFEGKRRKEQAEAGIRMMRESVDTLLVIRNERLREIYGNLSVKDAFSKADNILATAAKGIAELISVTGFVNVDMNDVISVMKDSGVAIMGQATAEGEDRSIRAVQAALESPLLNDNDIRGAKNILINITYGEEDVMMDEIGEITDYVQEAAGSTADVIFGYGMDASLGRELSVTIVATGFDSGVDVGVREETKKTYISLDDTTSLEAKPASRMSDPWQTEDESNTAQPANEPESTQTWAEKADNTYSDGSSNEPYIKRVDQNRPAETRQQSQDDSKTERKVYHLEDDVEQPLHKAENPTPEKKTAQLSSEEMQRRMNDRYQHIREIQRRIQTQSGINELEEEPAYRRRSIELDDVPHSSESQVSRYTLSEDEDEDGEKHVGLKPNNPYLHDNVD